MGWEAPGLQKSMCSPQKEWRRSSRAAWERNMTDKEWRFLVRLEIHEGDRIDAGQVQRLIVYLGGMTTADGYLFPDAARRAEAIGLLADRFGSKYFVLDDVQSRSL